MSARTILISQRDAIVNLTADNAALRADLNDARSNWESGAEELRQAELVREQLVAALRYARRMLKPESDFAFVDVAIAAGAP